MEHILSLEEFEISEFFSKNLESQKTLLEGLNNDPEGTKNPNPWERKNSKSNRYFLRSVSVGKGSSKEIARDMAEKKNLENIQNQAVFILKTVRKEFNLPEKALNKPHIKLESRGLDENSGVWFRKNEAAELAYVTQEIEINSIRENGY